MKSGNLKLFHDKLCRGMPIVKYTDGIHFDFKEPFSSRLLHTGFNIHKVILRGKYRIFRDPLLRLNKHDHNHIDNKESSN